MSSIYPTQLAEFKVSKTNRVKVNVIERLKYYFLSICWKFYVLVDIFVYILQVFYSQNYFDIFFIIFCKHSDVLILDPDFYYRYFDSFLFTRISYLYFLLFILKNLPL